MADYSDIIQKAAQTYNVDPALIRGIIGTESTNNPNAVSNKGATGLMQIMPSNYKALGITNPNDPTQNIMGGTKLVSQLLDRFGDVTTALRHYHGGDDETKWGPVNAAYPVKVLTAGGIMSQPQGSAMAKSQTLPGIPTAQANNNASDDEIFASFSKGAAPAKSGATGAQSDDAIFNAFAKAPAQPTQAAQPAAPASTPQAAPQAASTSGPLARFGQGAVALADTVAGAPGGAIAQGEYAVRRAFGQSPEQAQQGSEHGIGAFFQQPFAKAVNGIGSLFGDKTDIRNTAGYQNEASQQAMGYVGNKINQGAAAVANATGLPQQDVANMANTATLAVPGLVKGLAKAGGQAAIATALDDANVKPQPTTRPVGPAMQERQMAGGGAASSQSNPYPVFTGEEASRGAFPQVKTSKVVQDVTPAEQSVRAGVVNEILGDNAGQARTGVITGNENLLRDEHAAAKSPQETPANQAMKAQFAAEQNALSNYAQQRVEATGANQTLINNEQRGNVINDAFRGPDGLADYFKQAKQQIYDQARAESGDNPIQTSHVDDLVSKPAFQASADIAGNSGLVGGMARRIELARTVGFEDPITGKMTQPGSVAAWDAVRKANNADWSPANARLISGVNRAIDQDIASAAGSEAYKLGDRIHQVQQTLMGDPAFKKVFGEMDENGISSGIPAEQIPSKLNNMRLDQWRHIYNTLDDLSRGQVSGAPEGIPAVPAELQQMAAAARNEMSGALAREVYEQGASKAGVWNQNSVNKTLNSVVGQKILDTFPPDEVQRFHTLNYGGQIMPGVHSYEGAAQQAARLNKPGFVEKYAPGAGAAVGGAIGHAIPVPGAGVVGTLGGTKVGAGLSKLMEERRGTKQFEDLQRELRANSQRGLDRLR